MMKTAISMLEITLNNLDWDETGRQLDADGYAILSGLLSADAASHLARDISAPGLRKVTLGSNDLGSGDLLYFDAELPASLESLRSALYRHLAPIANRWNDILGINSHYPAEFPKFRQRNRDAGQTQPQSHLTFLAEGDYVSLHQRGSGAQVFPLQIVAVLSDPDTDFQGGEFVTTEQRPRMQSRPGVLPLKLGDIAIISTAERPFKGTKGYYRVNLKHAVSRLHGGERIGLELFFHDA